MSLPGQARLANLDRDPSTHPTTTCCLEIWDFSRPSVLEPPHLFYVPSYFLQQFHTTLHTSYLEPPARHTSQYNGYRLLCLAAQATLLVHTPDTQSFSIFKPATGFKMHTHTTDDCLPSPSHQGISVSPPGADSIASPALWAI